MKEVKVSDFAKKDGKLVKLNSEEFLKLPVPYDKISENLPDSVSGEGYVSDLDGFVAIDIEWKPRNGNEERELVAKFINGLRKLLDSEANWTFLYPLLLSLEYCTRCKSCSSACHVYLASGFNEIYRPTYRSEVFRRMINSQRRKIESKFFGSIEINAKAILRLAELAYRCNLCRRCAQFCPIGIDNALISREIRKLFSQELGIAPKALHTNGTIKQLRVGSSTGLT
ncbi:MAG: (Fe-S)-binding protein, partial [Archaeoglobaceae archaeon]|nr:(Fe-S)-binding protein [Archaeoglobaceae archaeon]